jgi:DNA-directed RNA polymerase specialized sigma24 family protein
MQQVEVLFSRYADGARPVRVLSDGWEVLKPDGTPERKHTTAVSLLSDLTGHPKGRHWSLERYFRIGPVHGARRPLVEANIFDLFPMTVTVPGIFTPKEMNKAPALHLKPKLGIDLDHRAGEVRKLLFAGFGRRMFLNGYDPEDVLQEVYKGLLVRNSGTCPWDPAKSSFGHYVHMVCGCILSNYHRKQSRIREVEQTGLLNPHGDGNEATRYMDVASNITVPAEATREAKDAILYEQADDLVDYMMDSEMREESRLATKLLPLILQGVPRTALPSTLGVSKAAVTRAYTHLKTQALNWKESAAQL